MKWFKHDVGAQRDLKLRLVLKQFGPSGIGIYWMLVELLADIREMSIDTNRIPLDVLSDEFRIDTELLKKTVDYFVFVGLLCQNSWSQKLIYCPALEKRVDEYSQRLRASGRVSGVAREFVGVEEKRTEEKRTEQKRLEEMWNGTRLPKIKAWSEKRTKNIMARLANPHFVASYPTCIKKLAESEFCNGQNDRGWKADIEFLIENDNNYIKILEEKYDNKYQPRSPFARTIGEKKR
jgi:hypothetical protein